MITVPRELTAAPQQRTVRSAPKVASLLSEIGLLALLARRVGMRSGVDLRFATHAALARMRLLRKRWSVRIAK